jgi:hypothetical protein
MRYKVFAAVAAGVLSLGLAAVPAAHAMAKSEPVGVTGKERCQAGQICSWSGINYADVFHNLPLEGAHNLQIKSGSFVNHTAKCYLLMSKQGTINPPMFISPGEERQNMGGATILGLHPLAGATCPGGTT